MNPERYEAAAKMQFEHDLRRGRVMVGTYENLRPYYEADAQRVLVAADEAEASELAAVRSALRSLVLSAEFYIGLVAGPTLVKAVEEARALLDISLPDGFVPLDDADYLNQEIALDGLSETPEGAQ